MNWPNSGNIGRKKKMEVIVHNKQQLEQFIFDHQQEIDQYFTEIYQSVPIPLYCSVDIRENNIKFAPVDNNLYPAGFNNLTDEDLMRASFAFQDTLYKVDPHIKRILLIPESHTKNLFYLDNIVALKRSLEGANFEVLLASFDAEWFQDKENLILTSYSGSELVIHQIKQDQLEIVEKWGGEWRPLSHDLIILNHDQSRPLSVDWSKITVPVCPSPYLGWYRRTKSDHFFFYHQVVQHFAQTFSINPHLLEAQFDVCEEIDFQSKEGLGQLEQKIDYFLSQLPTGSKVFVKANQGTYGMGISVVGAGQEILEMNRKARNKMDVGKNNLKFRSVILQESIETTIDYNGMPAEVSVYLVGGKPVGALLRANSEKGTQENLNAKGMILEKLPINHIELGTPSIRKELTYGLVARLSALASGYESLQVLSNNAIGLNHCKR